MSDIPRQQILKIAGAVILPNIGGYINGKITRNNIENWYTTLKFPTYRPPNWIFPVVWPTLYSCMGYASYLVWRDAGGFASKRAQLPLLLYGTQLALNWSWSMVFFQQRNIKGAFKNLLAIIAFTVPCAYTFHQVNKNAGYLMVPYIGWLCFAAKLNYDICKLNPQVDSEAEKSMEKVQ